MITTINDQWRIASDPLQWILDYRGEGKKYWRHVGYFRTLAEALSEASRKQIRMLEGECASAAE